MYNTRRTYIGLTTDDGYLVLQGGATIDILELLSIEQLVQAVSVAFTLRYEGQVNAYWMDDRIKIHGNCLPAKYGLRSTWTMLDELTPDQAIDRIQFFAENPKFRKIILKSITEGMGGDTLFSIISDPYEVVELSTLKRRGYFGLGNKTVDDRYYYEIYKNSSHAGDTNQLVAVREFSNQRCLDDLARYMLKDEYADKLIQNDI